MKRLINKIILTFCIGLPIANISDDINTISNNISTFNLILNLLTGIGIGYTSWIIAEILLKDKDYGNR
jgi:hypothetical protein